MNPDLYRKAKEAFAELLDLEGETRKSRLNELELEPDVRELVLELLSSHEDQGAVLRTGQSGVESSGVAEFTIPERIGDYVIVRCLGEGGMGVVFEAQQQRPERRVALKVVRPGFWSPRILRRFEQESQLLARLHHPGIAQVYEVGQYDGGHGPQPFFVMEFVDGVDLRQYAHRRHLSVRERIALIIQVSAAVHHAHERDVLHRDLKPDNILVDEAGHAKVLDFGLARTIEADLEGAPSLTGEGQILGTLPYMSPEQLAVKPLDARSDVYSLGVIAYELLAGSRPLDFTGMSLVEAARAAAEVEPANLTHRLPSARGDLATIVHQALAKDAPRRYRSAAEFAADLERYLDNRPIHARPASRAYLLRKFAGRHRGLFAGLTIAASILITAVIILTATTLRAREAEASAKHLANEESRLRTEAQDAKAAAEEREQIEIAVSDLLDRFLTAPDPVHTELPGNPDVRISDIVVQAEKQFDDFTGPPLVEAKVRDTLGRTCLHLARHDDAVTHLQRSYEIRERELGPDHADTAATGRYLAYAFAGAGHAEEAEAVARSALAFCRAQYAEDDPQTIDAMAALVEALRVGGANAEAEEVARVRFEISLDSLGEEDIRTLEAQLDLGDVLLRSGRLDEAEEALRETVDTSDFYHGGDHYMTLAAQTVLAMVLYRTSQASEGEAIIIDVYERQARVLGREHPDTLRSLDGIIRGLVRRGKTDESRQRRNEQLEAARKVLGEAHPRTLAWTVMSIQEYTTNGDHDKAAAEVKRVLQVLEENQLETSQFAVDVRREQGRSLGIQGLHSKSVDALEEAVRIARVAYPETDPRLADVLHHSADPLRQDGRLEEAEQALLEAHELLWPSTRGDRQRSKAARSLIDLYSKTGRPEAAQPFTDLLDALDE